MSSDSARPKATLQMILAQRRKRATGGAPKPGSKRKNESSLDAEAACSKKPATSSDSVPVEITPLASLPPEDREVSTPKGPNAPLPEMTLKLPEGFGRSRAFGHWPYLERLLLPGPRSSLEKRPLKEMADLEAEHAFESLQISLLIREKLTKLEDDVSLLQTEKRELLDQLDEERKEKAGLRGEADSVHISLKESEERLAQVLEVNNSLTAENKVLKEKKANLSKALTDAAACSSWEMKIACIREFQEGKHLSWDLEEEERLFADSFPEKVDLGILSDFEIDALEEDDGFSAAEEEEVQGGTHTADNLVPEGNSVVQPAPGNVPAPAAEVERVVLD
ncbi:uncharacterized protein LOC141607740 [Silene latifolia]|uniref:uncharacterized protein LOC141607740 n=1 Tax=Silene latifolia TaxID=37657 RepID=UPI003D76AA84